MDKVKKHFEEEAKEFDKIIRELIPYYEEMIDGMVAAIPHQRNDKINVIDLGCGTGNRCNLEVLQFCGLWWT